MCISLQWQVLIRSSVQLKNTKKKLPHFKMFQLQNLTIPEAPTVPSANCSIRAIVQVLEILFAARGTLCLNKKHKRLKNGSNLSTKPQLGENSNESAIEDETQLIAGKLNTVVISESVSE